MSELFAINSNRKVTKCIGSPSNSIKNEGELQKFVERNMEDLFGIRYVASEVHIGGLRIDTIGVDGKKCPVLIEYKKGQGDKAPGQILGYENAIEDNKDSFSLKVSHKLGSVESKNLNFNKIRLVCIAKDFHERVVSAWRGKSNVELITYRFFDHKILLLEWKKGPKSKRVKAHEAKKSKDHKSPSTPSPKAKKVQILYEGLSDEITKFGKDIESSNKKNLLRFKRKTTFACLRPVPTKGKLRVWVKLDPQEERIIPGFTRDVSSIMKDAGNCNLEISVGRKLQLRDAVVLCRKAYRAQGPSSSKPGPKLARPRAKKLSSSKYTKKTLRYLFNQCDDSTKALYNELSQGIKNLGGDVTQYETSRLNNFKISQLFAAVRPFPTKKKVTVLVKLDPKQEDIIPGFTRDTTNIATEANVCPLEITVKNQQQVKKALDLCRKAYNQSKR